ncbi:MAG: hypothetical protein LBP36_03045 [Oscillospiraceae bacterium]|nr:hypothetical protein [Oscillospiraceae bacterium]
MKAFEFERDWNNKISYVVVIRKGLLDFAGWHAYHAYGYGKKNVHYKEFASKNAANKYIEKQINELKK